MRKHLCAVCGHDMGRGTIQTLLGSLFIKSPRWPRRARIGYECPECHHLGTMVQRLYGYELEVW